MDDNTITILAGLGVFIVLLIYWLCMMTALRPVNKAIKQGRQKQWEREKEIHDFLKEKEDRYMKKTRERWEKEDKHEKR